MGVLRGRGGGCAKGEGRQEHSVMCNTVLGGSPTPPPDS